MTPGIGVTVDVARALRSPGFRWLWLGGLLANVGTWIQEVALTWLLYARFSDPVLLGLRGVAANVPFVGLMVIGGVMADRHDRRGWLLRWQVIQCAVVGGAAALESAGRMDAAAIMIVVALGGVVLSQSGPVTQALVAELVPPAQTGNAVALMLLQLNISRVLGPIMAGVLLTLAGSTAALAVAAVAFVAAALMFRQMPQTAARESGVREGVLHGLAEGVRYVRRTTLWQVTAFAWLSTYLGFSLLSFLPLLADSGPGTGAVGYGALLSIFGAGAIVGALLAASNVPRGWRPRLLPGCWTAAGIATAAALAVPLAVTPALVLAGLTLTMAAATLNTIAQEHAPSDVRGRILSIYGVALCSGAPVGALVAAPLVRHFGVVPTMGTYAAALSLVGVALLAHAPTWLTENARGAWTSPPRLEPAPPSRGAAHRTTATRRAAPRGD